VSPSNRLPAHHQSRCSYPPRAQPPLPGVRHGVGRVVRAASFPRSPPTSRQSLSSAGGSLSVPTISTRGPYYLYPGDMDRYADHLGAAAEASTTRIKPKESGKRAGGEAVRPVARGFKGALGGTRTPNLQIRRLCHADQRPGHLLAGQMLLVGSRRLALLCSVVRPKSGQFRVRPSGKTNAPHAELRP
jgi:hypothetical protein